MDDHGQIPPRVRQRAFRPQRGRLGLQQILGGLDQHRVDAAGQHSFDLLLVGVP
jgi:hypothetical protein